jgi:hypothetical protein
VDFDVFGPLLEFGDDFLLGFLAFLLKPAFLDVQFGGAVFAAAQAGDVLAEAVQDPDLVLEFVGDFAVPVLQE